MNACVFVFIDATDEVTTNVDKLVQDNAVLEKEKERLVANAAELDKKVSLLLSENSNEYSHFIRLISCQLFHYNS